MKRPLTIAAALAVVAVTTPPAQAAATYTYVWNEASTAISVACSNGGAIHVAEPYHGYRCAGGDVWLYVACNTRMLQTNKLGVWFTWRKATGWWRDDDGGDFAVRPDSKGC